MAAWFARCESDGAAHTLFDAAFGLSSVDHLGLAVPDVESDGPFASWWDIDPVDVPLSLRAYGRRPARGSTAKRRDYSAAKAMIEAERAAEAARLADAAARLVSLDLSRSRIGHEEWPTLLRLLDEALAARDLGPEFSATVRTTDAVVRIESADHDTRLLAPAGSVVLHRCRIEVLAA
jgi:hypothetical protein